MGFCFFFSLKGGEDVGFGGRGAYGGTRDAEDGGGEMITWIRL